MPASSPRAFGPRPVAHSHASARREASLDAPQEMAPERVRAVIEVSIRASELMLASGASASTATALATRLAGALGLVVGVDITYTRIVVSQDCTVTAPITVMRLAPAGGQDYDRLARVEHLVKAVTRDGLDLQIVQRRLRHIASEPRDYAGWLRLLASAVLGGGIALMLNGGIADVLACMLATIGVERVRSALITRRVSNFFSQAIAAILPTVLGLLVMAMQPVLGDRLPLPTPSTVVAAGMVSLLAGIGVVTAASDAVDGYYLTASARILEVTVLTAAIVVGLLTTLSLGLALGVPGQLVPTADSEGSWPLRLLAGGLVAICFGVGCVLAPASLPAAMVLGVLAQASYLVFHQAIPSAPAASGLTAILLGLLARLASRRLRTPTVALVTTSVASLMPGLLLYRGVFAVLFNAPMQQGESAASILSDCALTAILLAAGSSLGLSLAGLLLRIMQHSPEVALAPVATEDEELDRPRSSRIFTAS